MLRIMATAFKNQPLERPFGTDFKENGGTIGRSTESTIILPDDKRYISRIQASVRFNEGRYLLAHHGPSNDWEGVLPPPASVAYRRTCDEPLGPGHCTGTGT